MDRDEARAVLLEQLAPYRRRTYAQLVGLVGQNDVIEAVGPSGAHYILEIQVFSEGPVSGPVMVSGGVDDGRWPSAFVPLLAGFVMSPDGRIQES